MTEPPAATSIEKVYADMLGNKLADIADRLHKLADMAEREAVRLGAVPSPVRATYASVIGRVQHDILWGLANLNLASLTDSAQQADEYRIKGE